MQAKKIIAEHGYETDLTEEVDLPLRQAQILHGILDGLYNNQIAKMLGISIKTVEKHRCLLFSTLNISRGNEVFLKICKKMKKNWFFSPKGRVNPTLGF